MKKSASSGDKRKRVEVPPSPGIKLARVGEDMPPTSPAAPAAGPSSKFQILYRRPPSAPSPPIGTPPGFTSRDTSPEEMAKFGSLDIGAPAPQPKNEVTTRSIKGWSGKLSDRFGGRRRTRRVKKYRRASVSRKLKKNKRTRKV